MTATSPSDLAAAEDSLKRAQALNPEETGALLAMGEVALLRGDHAAAEEHLAAATQTNPKAAVAFFLRGWLALQRGDEAGARQWLSRTREALGADWHPQGTTSEGDVARKQHEERTPLGGFCAAWNGDMEPRVAYTPLKAFLDAAGVRYRSAAASSVAK